MVERVWDSLLLNLRRSYKMFIELSAAPCAPLYDLVLMPKRSQKEDWVAAIRISIRDTLGNKNWQIRESKGKASLGIRFDNGTRTYKNIPYKWLY